MVIARVGPIALGCTAPASTAVPIPVPLWWRASGGNRQLPHSCGAGSALGSGEWRRRHQSRPVHCAKLQVSSFGPRLALMPPENGFETCADVRSHCFLEFRKRKNTVSDDQKRPILVLITSHWISMAGVTLVTLAGFSWLFVLPTNIRGHVG